MARAADWKYTGNGTHDKYYSEGPFEIRTLLMDTKKCAPPEFVFDFRGNKNMEECGAAQPICEFRYSADVHWCATSRKCNQKGELNPYFDSKRKASLYMPRTSESRLLEKEECSHPLGCSETYPDGTPADCKTWYLYQVGVMGMFNSYFLNTVSVRRMSQMWDTDLPYQQDKCY